MRGESVTLMSVRLAALMMKPLRLVSFQVRGLELPADLQPPGRPAGPAGRHGNRWRRRSVQIHR